MADPAGLPSDELVAILSAGAPEGWRRLELKARIVADVEEYEYTVLFQDSTVSVSQPPPGIADPFHRWRRRSYEREEFERGAWYTARVLLDRELGLQMAESADIEPDWENPPAADSYRLDAQTFTRDEFAVEYTPSWLRPLLGMEFKELPGDAKRMHGGFWVEQDGLHELSVTLRALLVWLPLDWTTVHVDYQAVGPRRHLAVSVTGLDGRIQPWQPPAGFAEYFERYRQGNRVSGDPAWISLSLDCGYGGQTDWECSFDPPPWDEPPTAQECRAELELFNVWPAYVPEWLLATATPVTDDFGWAKVFDAVDPDGGPRADRARLDEADKTAVLEYLNERGGLAADDDLGWNEAAGRRLRVRFEDVLAETQTDGVRARVYTDGTWIWSDAVGYYLDTYDVPPQPELTEHILRYNREVERRKAEWLDVANWVPPEGPMEPLLRKGFDAAARELVYLRGGAAVLGAPYPGAPRFPREPERSGSGD